MTLQHANRVRKDKGEQLIRELETVEAGAALRETPLEADIQQRAHEIYLRRNGTPGDALVDWLQAEVELRVDRSQARSAARASKRS